MSVLKRLLPYFFQNKRYVFAMIFFGLIMSVAELTVSNVTKIIFDGFQNKDLRAAVTVSLYIPAVYFIHGIARFLHWFFLKMIAEFLSTRLQRELQEKYMQLTLGYYGVSDTGGMISKTI